MIAYLTPKTRTYATGVYAGDCMQSDQYSSVTIAWLIERKLWTRKVCVTVVKDYAHCAWQ